MLRALPRSTRTDTLFPYSTLFRARSVSARREFGGGRLSGRLAIGTIVDDHPEALDGRGIDVRGRELRRDRQPVADLLGGHNPSPVCYAVAGRRAGAGRSTRRCNAKPASIARTNTPASRGRSARSAMAGPGHSPAMPQPIPNSIAPQIGRAHV